MGETDGPKIQVVIADEAKPYFTVHDYLYIGGRHATLDKGQFDRWERVMSEFKEVQSEMLRQYLWANWKVEIIEQGENFVTVKPPKDLETGLVQEYFEFLRSNGLRCTVWNVGRIVCERVVG